MPKFNNAYEVLEHLMNNSKDKENSMWGLIKNEFDRLNNENAELKQENERQGMIIADLDFRLMIGGM